MVSDTAEPVFDQLIVEAVRIEVAEARLAGPAPPPVRLHPNLAQLYRSTARRWPSCTPVSHLELRAEAMGLIRGLVERVELHPTEDAFHIELVGAGREQQEAPSREP